MKKESIHLPCITLPWLTAHAVAYGKTLYYVNSWTPYNDRVNIWTGIHCWKSTDIANAEPSWIKKGKPVVQRILAVAKIESVHELDEVTENRAKIKKTFCGRQQFRAEPDRYSVWEARQALWRFKDVALLPEPVYAPGTSPKRPNTWIWPMTKEKLGAELFAALQT